MLVTFSAAELDGPSVYEIPITSVHPIDHQEGDTTFRLGITNVAPTITQFGVFNTMNQQLGVDVPYFIDGCPRPCGERSRIPANRTIRPP